MCEAIECIECENNYYLDMNFNIDLNLCKISHKMLSNHNTFAQTHYYSTHYKLNNNTFKCLHQNCGKSYKYKHDLKKHELIHNKSIEYLKCFWPKCQFKTIF